MASESLSFIDALRARGPAGNRAEQMMLYGQFVGSWDGTVTAYRANGERSDSTCEAHFAWALAGRAIQDVWIAPSRVGRAADACDRMYGTTLRIYDLAKNQWQILWVDPVRRACRQMTSRQVGADIVQEYRDSAGAICQSRFTDIEADSFHWTSRESADEGTSWRLTGDFHLRRRRRQESKGGAQSDANSEQLQAFGFWRGAWRVTDPQSGKPLGVSRVDSILGGHVLHEQWSGADGYCGESFNIFDKDRQCWHQSWVSDNGTLLLLDGGVRQGAMDLQGTSPNGERQRIRWTPRADGSVLQLWESSSDDGRSWRQRFAGLYRRA